MEQSEFTTVKGVTSNELKVAKTEHCCISEIKNESPNEFTVAKKFELRHAIEIFTYLLVGGSAWIVQTIMYVLLLKISIFPSVAMIIGTVSGMFVSYFGHTKYTFKKTHKFSHKEFMKFGITSMVGLIINVSSVRLITKVLHLHPHYAIIPTIFTPAITFLISKFWAFK